MRRKNFIMNVAAATGSILVKDNLFAFPKVERFVPDSKDLIDPVIPISFKNHYEETLSAVIKLRANYGFRRFMVLSPEKTIRFSGFPERQVFQDIGELILKVKKSLSSYDIEIGWECSATIKQGPGVPYQKLTGIDGKVSEISFCPLGQDFKKTFSGNICTVVSVAHPFLINIEDDYTLGHAGFGCFCPLHLAEFAKRQQHNYSREDLYNIFSQVNPESIRLRRAWAELCCDSLTELAAFIRKDVDKIAPETRICLLQSGSADFYGDFTEPVTRAFAGKTRPAVRLYGTDYGHDNAERLPEIIFHALYNSQRLPPDFELYHESDTFPHTRFFMSAAKIKSLMMAAFAYGLDDSRFHPVQNTDNPLEELGYVNMFKSEINRFNALKSAVKDCSVDGCEIMYEPFEHIVNAYGKGSKKRYAWANVTGRLGIPHTAMNGRVKMISGSTVGVMSDDTILKLLSGSIFLDGYAAYLLYKRGFGDLIGANVLPGDQPQFLYEGIRNDADFKNITGKIMYNFLIFVVATEGGEFFQLKPLEGAKILTDFLDGEEKPVIPGLIRFENKLGGRVAITAFDLDNNSSSAVINYKKKEIMRQTIEWLGKESLPVYVKELPNVFCIFNRSISNDYAVVVIISLCSDPFNSFSLELSSEWSNSRIQLLNSAGEWSSLRNEKNNSAIKVNEKLVLMDPVILKLEK